MRAARYHQHGDPSVLRVEEVPDSAVGCDDVLIRVAGAGVNRLDVQQRRGPAVMPDFSLPHIAGMDIAGTVVANGRDVDSFAVGDRVVVNPRVVCGRCAACVTGDDRRCPHRSVIGAGRAGGYAQLCAVPHANVHRLPSSISVVDAAASVTAMSTAWRAIVHTGSVREGEIVVVQAANSGVSTFATQIARSVGARVIAVARSDAKLAATRHLGAELTINSVQEDVVGAVKQMTGGRGADVVIDHVGGATLDVSLRSLAPGGRLVVCGATTGPAPIDLARLYRTGLAIVGVEPYSQREFATILDWWWRSDVKPLVDSCLALDDVVVAHERMERHDVIGKLVLIPNEGDASVHD